MAKHVNKVMLIGNVGKDPEIRYLPSGDPVAQFSIATSKTVKDSAGEKKEYTEWHNVVAHYGLATIVQQLFKKGCLVYVEGEARTRKVAATDHHPERYFHEVVVGEVSLLRDAKPLDSSQDYPPPPPDRAAANNRQPAAARNNQAGNRSAPPARSAPQGQSQRPRGQQAPQTDFDGEDIPFHAGDAQI